MLPSDPQYRYSNNNNNNNSSSSSSSNHLPLFSNSGISITGRRDSVGPLPGHLLQEQTGMVNMFPAAAGHQLDINHLWQQVQELSAILAQNRESTAGLVRRADEIRSRTNLGEAMLSLREVNGEINGTHEIDFEAENRTLRQENHDLKAENVDLSLLVQDYETVLEKVLDGLRVYAHEHTVSTINIHQTYTNQLANERQANAVLRQNETEAQARLTTISTLLREAYEQETALEPDILIEGLKVENEALREALGLPKEEREDETSPV